MVGHGGVAGVEKDQGLAVPGVERVGAAMLAERWEAELCLSICEGPSGSK